MKNDIIQDLKAQDECGLIKSAQVVKAIEAGQFDEDINELQAISVTEAADLILDLARIRGIRV